MPRLPLGPDAVRTSVPSRPAASLLLPRFGAHTIDLLVVDVGAAQLEVLQGLDWQRLTVNVLLVGPSGGEQAAAAVADLLQARSFEPVEKGTAAAAAGGHAVFVRAAARDALQEADDE